MIQCYGYMNLEIKMNNMKKRIKNNNVGKYTVLIAIIIIAILCFETIGFATLNDILTLNSNVTFEKDGILEITKVTLTTSTRATQSSTPDVNGVNATFHVSLSPTRNGGTSTITYRCTLKNNSSFNQTISNASVSKNSFTNTNNVSVGTPSISGLTSGTTLSPGQEINFTVTLTASTTSRTSYTSTGNIVLTLNNTAGASGSLIGNLQNNTFDLVNNQMVEININVLNTKTHAHDLSFALGTNKITLVNSNGQSLGLLSIAANDTQTLKIYAKIADGVEFSNSPYNTDLTMTCNDGSVIHLGHIYFTVPVNENIQVDADAPIITSVTASKNNTLGKIDVTYAATDESDISGYYVIKCIKQNNNYNCDDEISTTQTSHSFTNLDPGTYMFKVYAIDEYENVASSSDIQNANTSSGPAMISSDLQVSWPVTITFELTNLNYDGSNSSGTVNANYKESYSFTLSGNSAGFGQYYYVPSDIKLEINNEVITEGYTYTPDSGNNPTSASVVIAKGTLTGNAKITAEDNGCLVEGTKILLANGEYKNIEDITYYDLLAVWSYDSGKIEYTYPIWIEQKKRTNNYQVTTFSDGSILKTVMHHGIFNADLNRFVSVDDRDSFNIGTNVLKVDSSGNLKKVKVVNIELKNDTVNYYHVVSTRYYNIIANDFLTTDGTVVLSNLYGFDENLKWKNKTYDKAYSYDDFKDIIPYYMFVGMRMHEGIYLQDYGLDLQTFKYYLAKNQVNKNMILPVPTINNRRVFIVSALNQSKKIFEGKEYVLPGNNKKFLNTTDNKIYKSGDKVKIYTSTYFKEISN